MEDGCELKIPHVSCSMRCMAGFWAVKREDEGARDDCGRGFGREGALWLMWLMFDYRGNTISEASGGAIRLLNGKGRVGGCRECWMRANGLAQGVCEMGDCCKHVFAYS